MQDPLDAPEPRLPPSLRLLKWLVMGLTLTMIFGVITVVWLLVTRMPDYSAAHFPEKLALPEGTKAEAITRGRGWTGVVTTDGRLLIFGTDGALRQEIAVDLP